MKHAKFTKKADVFAAGVVFLELIALCSPGHLYEILWPRVLEVSLPTTLKEILRMCLAAAPETRTGSFEVILQMLKCDEGKAIGELSKDDEVSFDISSEMDSLLPSILATGQW